MTNTKINLCSLRSTLIAAAVAIGVAGPALAYRNVEYPEPFETEYLGACGAGMPDAACVCSLRMIGDRFSAEDFAAAVYAFNGVVTRDPRHGATFAAIETLCLQNPN